MITKVLSLRLILTVILFSLLSGGAIASPLPAKSRPYKAMEQVNVDITTAGTGSLGTVTLRYMHQGRWTNGACSILHCQFRLPYGTKITMSQRPHSGHHFRSWIVSVLGVTTVPTRTITKSTFPLTLNALYDVQAVYK